MDSTGPGRPFGSGVVPRPKKIKNHSFGLSDKDAELIAWIAEFLSTTKNEAMRAAIRSYASQLATLEKRMGKPSEHEREEVSDDAA